ncbi:1,4-alpha-glucan branching enzyme GlgB [Frankliniella fusca]|uniref:1,4-alpha-glucan branching enzyme GlgB n=1 Tax=Frankliniella fusca TaxID=407009 RepID=A0AAE1H8I6_9NEOP|nr:1,4-alpha-glucan branching enzyme GlgB [Frankliniella fusca]
MLVAAAVTAVMSVLLTTCMLAQPGRAQIGSDCSDTEPCAGNQECSLGYCRCPQGFVKHGSGCLPGRMNAESNTVFMGMMWTGLAVMLIGLALGTGCIFYGCCYEWLLTSGPTHRAQQTMAPNTSRSYQSNPGQAHRPANQGTGVDYIPALYETTSFDVI